ncbi:hypothetical protein NAD41_002386 [Salmonella enterica]|nr:hypothetical protein [Salmonella enterica]EKK6596354.1 hypothetical protein [Salmonella enterica]
MYQWVKVVESRGYQVCLEKGVEEGMPAITFRLTKDGGILRSRMCIPPDLPTKRDMLVAVDIRDHIFANLDQEAIDAAVDSMLEMEPEVMDGSTHAFMMEGNGH